MKDILKTLKEKMLEMIEVIPNLITAIAIFIVGYILAKFLRKVIRKVLLKTGIDRLADRLNDVDLIASSSVDIVPSKLLSSIVYYMVLLVFVMASVEALGMKALSDLMTELINYVPKAISALFVLIIGVLIIDMIKKVVQTTCESLGIASAKLLGNVVFYFLFLNVALITLKQAELQTAFMENNISIVLAGVILAFSIGYGLASKSLMANMLAAFYAKDKFEEGDEVTVEGKRGVVINLDSTTLTVRVDEGEMVVPLSKLSNEKYFIHRKSKYIPLDEGESPQEK